MFPINCKHSFITVSDTIYSVLNCTNWNFIINTLHTCFKLINIFKFMSLAFFIPHTISIGSMSGEWGGLVSISQLLYQFNVSTDTCLASLFIYKTILSSKCSIIFGRKLKLIQYIFLVHATCEENQWEFLLYVKLFNIHFSLVFRFSLFFMKLLTWKYPSFNIEIVCLKMRSSVYTYLAL